VLVFDMIEILPPLGKYKYNTWRILSVKCYIDNSMRLRSCIQNINKRLSWGSTDTLASLMELTRAREMEDATTLASAHKDAKGLVQKVSLIKGELAEVCWARVVAEEKVYSLPNGLTDRA
jgi:hypothetical protein